MVYFVDFGFFLSKYFKQDFEDGIQSTRGVKLKVRLYYSNHTR